MLGDKIGKTPEVTCIGKDFLNRTTVTQETVPRINKCGHVNLRSFDTIKKNSSVQKKNKTVKRQSTK